MVTDSELFAAIEAAVREVKLGKIGVGIAVRDIRAAIRKFDEQPTISVSEQPHDG
jgi:hypothetical protein